jgi:excisionase family DNA binding protein
MPGALRDAHLITRKDTVIVRSDLQQESRLLTPAEVAALFRVDPKTVTRWAQQGKIHSIRTLGGHRRYSEAEVQAFLDSPQHVPVPRIVHD